MATEGKTASGARRSKPTRVGLVVKAAAVKTVTVKVDRLEQHKMYEKIVRRSRNYLVHDENGEAGVGDTVRIMECRPVSKRKRWRLVEIIEKAK